MAYADYTAPTGQGGRLLMRVHDAAGGELVEFFIEAGNNQTWVSGRPWSWSSTSMGGGSGSYSYSGGGLQRIGYIYVHTNQTIAFSIDSNTNTIGLGGPAGISVYIQRATVPTAPRAIAVDNIGHTSMRFRFTGISDGGSPILQWQIGYGTSSAGPQLYVDSNGTTTINNLMPSTNYYFWARGRNAFGWSGWSGRAGGQTLAGLMIKWAGNWRKAVPYVKVNGVWRPAVPYFKKNNKWDPTKV